MGNKHKKKTYILFTRIKITDLYKKMYHYPKVRHLDYFNLAVKWSARKVNNGPQ